MVSSPSGTSATSASGLNSTQRTSEARAAFTATLTSIGSTLDGELQTRASDIHANSGAIAKQEAEVAKQSAALRKESERYQKIADESRGKLKEIGDIQNWAEMLERDLLVLEETMRLGEDGARERRKNAAERGVGDGVNGWH